MFNFIKQIRYALYTRNKEHSIGKNDYTQARLRAPNFSIGDYTYGAPKVIDGTGNYKLTIGKFCSFGSDVTIMLAANHRIDWPTTYPIGLIKGMEIPDYNTGKGDITIGHDVWVGDKAIIMSGITIGNGAVIGAGSIVTKDVEPYQIVAGNPAKPIRHRFTAEQIARLQEMKWWDWDIKKIRDNKSFLTNTFK